MPSREPISIFGPIFELEDRSQDGLPTDLAKVGWGGEFKEEESGEFFVLRAERVEDGGRLLRRWGANSSKMWGGSSIFRLRKPIFERRFSLSSVRSSNHSSRPKIEDGFVLRAKKVEDGRNFFEGGGTFLEEDRASSKMVRLLQRWVFGVRRSKKPPSSKKSYPIFEEVPPIFHPQSEDWVKDRQGSRGGPAVRRRVESRSRSSDQSSRWKIRLKTQISGKLKRPGKGWPRGFGSKRKDSSFFRSKNKKMEGSSFFRPRNLKKGRVLLSSELQIRRTLSIFEKSAI